MTAIAYPTGAAAPTARTQPEQPTIGATVDRVDVRRWLTLAVTPTGDLLLHHAAGLDRLTGMLRARRHWRNALSDLVICPDPASRRCEAR